MNTNTDPLSYGGSKKVHNWNFVDVYVERRVYSHQFGRLIPFYGLLTIKVTPFHESLTIGARDLCPTDLVPCDEVTASDVMGKGPPY